MKFYKRLAIGIGLNVFGGGLSFEIYGPVATFKQIVPITLPISILSTVILFWPSFKKFAELMSAPPTAERES